MGRITGIVFDKDGTLFDFMATWGAWSRTFLSDLAEGDVARAAALGQAIGYDHASGRFAAESPVIADTADLIAARLLPLLPGTEIAPLVARMNAAAALTAMVEAVPLGPLLAGLRAQGLRLGLATNDAEAPARAHLKGAGIEAAFDFIAGYDSGFGAKPAPGMLTAFTKAMALQPGEVLMVGDSAHDLVAARAAGMRPIAVLTGVADAAELAPLAEVVLPDIGHLPDWIGSAASGT